MLQRLGFFYIGLGVFALSANAQLTLRTIKEKSNVTHHTHGTSEVTLPFWDDFSISGESPDSIQVWDGDTSALWDLNLSRGTYVSPTLAIDPPTYQAVTFDGLQSDGQIYAEEGRGITDRLVTRLINLQGIEPVDSVIISFYWQAGGNVEAPDPKDSIYLYLSNPDTTELLWSQTGIDSLRIDTFYYVQRALPPRLQTDSVRFTFEAFGDQNGPFDAWHLDWIYFNAGGRNPIPNSFEDVAYTGQIINPLKPFKSIPFEVLKSDPNEYLFDQQVTVRSLDLSNTIRTVSFFYSILDLINNTTLTTVDTDIIIPLSANSPQQTVNLPFPEIAIEDLPDNDSLLIQTVFWHSPGEVGQTGDGFLDGSRINLRVNDTVRVNSLLTNYYAFDDGSAEYAVGTNVINGQVAVKYWVGMPDTLTHVDILFPNISPLADGQPLDLRILSKLVDETDDQSAVLRSQQITVQTATGIDVFTRYALNTPVIISDTFFISYRQNVNEYIGVGFDRSNPEASQYIFENFEGEWVKNLTVEGAIMIRPVFEQVPDSVDITGVAKLDHWLVYPNPTTGIFQISGFYDHIKVMDMAGNVILHEPKKERHTIRSYPPGLYVVNIIFKGRIITKKIILK